MNRTSISSTNRRPTSASERRAAVGFTLLELLVTLTVIGLAMSVVVSGSSTLLPKTRLHSTGEELGSALGRARSWAVLEGQPFVFCYDLDARTYAAWLPYATDDEGREVGPGQTFKIATTPLEPGIAIAQVRLPGGMVRDQGQVTLEISAMGRVPPHELVVVNPEHPETEVLTVRVNGLANRCQVLKGDLTMQAVTDADFR